MKSLTNHDRPFQQGDIIRFAGDDFEVVRNFGIGGGLVKPLGDEDAGSVQFKWTFEGEDCILVRAAEGAVGTEHTPGPWEWHFSGTAGRWSLSGNGGAGVQAGGPPDSPLSADQRLIAAAPDLYQALKTLVAEIGDDMRYERKDVCDAVDAALAKASGRDGG
jgi:hypothetical protein